MQVGPGEDMRSYAMRDLVRSDGVRWSVQARHDGELCLLTVHPAHLPCYSGVTWLSLADTGELVACGSNTGTTSSNTGATVFVAPRPPACNSSCSTGGAGEPVWSCPTRSSSTLRSSHDMRVIHRGAQECCDDG